MKSQPNERTFPDPRDSVRASSLSNVTRYQLFPIRCSSTSVSSLKVSHPPSLCLYGIVTWFICRHADRTFFASHRALEDVERLRLKQKRKVGSDRLKWLFPEHIDIAPSSPKSSGPELNGNGRGLSLHGVTSNGFPAGQTNDKDDRWELPRKIRFIDDELNDEQRVGMSMPWKSRVVLTVLFRTYFSWHSKLCKQSPSEVSRCPI